MKRSERGFTLLELLIAVSLLALLMTLLVGGMRIGTRHLARQADQVDRSQRAVLIQHFLRAELADAQSLPDPGAGRSGGIVFAGRANGVTFVGPTPASVATGGLQVLSLDFAAEGAARGAIVANWRLYGGAEGTAAVGPRRSVLLDHIRGASFTYFGGVPGETPSWHSTWTGMTELPSLVRLSVEFADGDVMPELVVALRLSPAVAGQASATSEQ
jgi:general secretion pathway protein J